MSHKIGEYILKSDPYIPEEPGKIVKFYYVDDLDAPRKSIGQKLYRSYAIRCAACTNRVIFSSLKDGRNYTRMHVRGLLLKRGWCRISRNFDLVWMCEDCWEKR